MRMTAKYAYARNRNILLPSVLDEIMSWSGYSSERKTFREVFPRSSDTPFRPLASGGKEVSEHVLVRPDVVGTCAQVTVGTHCE